MSFKLNPFSGSLDLVTESSIGSPIIGGTAGSVLFVDSSGNLAQDNSNFNWDDSNNHLNLSSQTAHGQLNILGVGGGYLRIAQGPTLAHGSIDLGVLNPKAGLFRTNSGNSFLYYSTATGDTVLNNVFGSGSKVKLQYADVSALEIDSNKTVTVNGFTASSAGLIVKGAASQTANLTEWKDSSGTVLASVGPSGKTTIGVPGGKNPYLDILVGVGTGLNNEAASMRLRQNTVDGNGFVLNLGVNNTPVGGSNQGYGYIQASYWGGAYTNPLKLQPQGGQIMCGNVSQAHDWALSAKTAIAVASPTNPVSGGAGTIMGKIAFNASGYVGEMSWIGGIFDKSGFYQGAGLVFNTVTGADVAGYDGTEKMRISSDGTVTINGFSSSSIGLVVKGAASQSANLTEWQNSGGTALSYIRPDGSLKPASLSDAAAANDSIYYSTTASKLVYKDSGGTVNSLY